MRTIETLVLNVETFADRAYGGKTYLWKRVIYLEKLMDYENDIIIYGAGENGKVIYDYLTEKFPEKTVRFAVTKLEDLMATARQQNIFSIDEVTDLKERAIVILSTREKFWGEIRQNLESKGFVNIIGVDSKAIQLLN